MKSGLCLNTKFDIHKNTNTNTNNVSVSPINNINVNVRNRSIDPDSLEGVEVITPEGSYTPVEVKYDTSLKYTDDDIKTYEKTIEALKIIIDMMKQNPIMVNNLILVDDDKLSRLVLLLTDADEVSIDAEDIGGCCTPNKIYRKVNAIYVIKDGTTKNLKYDFPAINKQLKELGINTKIVW